MAKVKEVSTYSGSAWGTAVPIGADDKDIDLTAYNASTNPGGTNNPSDSTATLAGLDNTDVTAASGDTLGGAWTKFNKFRKRVKNVFGNYVAGTLATAYTTSSATSKVYSASVLNNYMSNVIGYTGTTAPSEGTVASQLSSLNSKIPIFPFTDFVNLTDLNVNDTFTVPYTGFYTLLAKSIDSDRILDYSIVITSGPYSSAPIARNMLPAIGGSFSQLVYMQSDLTYKILTKTNVNPAYLYYHP